jgi:hypothetical protein
VQSLFDHQEAGGYRRVHPRDARSDRQSAADAWRLSGLRRADCSQRTGRRARAHAGTLGHAGTAAIRWGTDHQHSQHGQSALAGLAECRAALRRAFNFFCEYADTKPRKDPDVVCLGRRAPAGLLRRHLDDMARRARHESQPVEGEHQLFGFLPTDANVEVGAVHPKAMPVILTSAKAVEQWLTLPPKDALALQKPLPDGALRIVATGEKEDGLAA